jgi:hypothetical protein
MRQGAGEFGAMFGVKSSNSLQKRAPRRDKKNVRATNVLPDDTTKG